MSVGLEHSAVEQPRVTSRLLHGLASGCAADPGLRTHLNRWGELTFRHGLLDELDASGLVGHGGAWFPVATKWRAVANASRRRPVVVANGAEGEPASRKDALLLSQAPHLVLDGLALAASTLGARQAIAYVPASSLPTIEAALAERRAHGVDPITIELAESPENSSPVRSPLSSTSSADAEAQRPPSPGSRPSESVGSEVVPHSSRTSRRWPMSPSSLASERTGSGVSARMRTRAPCC